MSVYENGSTKHTTEIYNLNNISVYSTDVLLELKKVDLTKVYGTDCLLFCTKIRANQLTLPLTIIYF